MSLYAHAVCPSSLTGDKAGTLGAHVWAKPECEEVNAPRGELSTTER